MTIINTNSISGINSITAQGASGIEFYESSGVNQRLHITSAGLIDISGGIQVSENVTPTSGEGVEIFAPSSGTGQIQSFDRTNNNFDKLIIKGDPVEIYDGSTKKFETTSSGLTIYEDTNKTISFTGGIGEIGNVTGFQALNTAGSALVDFGMRATTLRFATGSAERLRITSGGEVQIANGNLKFSTAGTGIDFSAAADIATGETISSSVLDDYEEGTFTPTVSVEGQGSNATTDKQYGRYVKVGKMVTVWCYVQLNGTPSGRSTSNAWQHGGLPFIKQNVASGVDTPGAIIYWTIGSTSNLSGTGPYMLVARLFNNTAGGRIRAHSSDATQSGQNASFLLQNNTEYSYTFTYEATA